MLKEKDLTRTKFAKSELVSYLCPSPKIVKFITPPKNIDVCLHMIKQDIVKCLANENLLNNTVDHSSGKAEFDSIQEKLVLLRSQLNRSRNMHDRIVRHIMLNDKAEIIESFSFSNTPELKNYIKFKYGNYEFLLTVSKEKLLQLERKNIPYKGIYEKQDIDDLVYESDFSKYPLTIEEAKIICGKYAKHIANCSNSMKERVRKKTEEILTNNRILKLINEKIRSGEAVIVEEHEIRKSTKLHKKKGGSYSHPNSANSKRIGASDSNKDKKKITVIKKRSFKLVKS